MNYSNKLCFSSAFLVFFIWKKRIWPRLLHHCHIFLRNLAFASPFCRLIVVKQWKIEKDLSFLQKKNPTFIGQEALSREVRQRRLAHVKGGHLTNPWVPVLDLKKANGNLCGFYPVCTLAPLDRFCFRTTPLLINFVVK